MKPSAGGSRGAEPASYDPAFRHTTNLHERFSASHSGSVLHAIVASCFEGPGPLQLFIRDVFCSLNASLLGNRPPYRNGDLFLCPLAAHSSSLAPRSARRRSRWHRERLVRLAVDVAICSLNWLALGRPRRC
jgi:hypothetical protein